MKTELSHPILQYPTDLIFATTAYDVSSLLTVLKSRTVIIKDYEIAFAIIGESHCITITRDGEFVMQEVLACTDIPAILQANSHKFAKLEPYHYDKEDYQARVWFHDKLQLDNRQIGNRLRMDFPETFGQIPFTQIDWQLCMSSIRWRTIHVYPLGTHTTYVYTETDFNLAGRSNNE